MRKINFFPDNSHIYIWPSKEVLHLFILLVVIQYDKDQFNKFVFTKFMGAIILIYLASKSVCLSLVIFRRLIPIMVSKSAA